MNNYVKIFFIIVLFCSFILSDLLIKKSVKPFEYFFVYKLPLEKYFILDSVGVILGLRKFVSDIAWIQLLQYYGSKPWEIGEEEKSEDIHEHRHYYIQEGKYRRFLDYSKRIIILNPYHSIAYFVSISVLAWNLKRPNEALEIADIAIKNLEFQKNDPEGDFWEIVKYKEAIYYTITGEYEKMLMKLKEIVSSGKAPNKVKSILANLYKKYGKYEEALRIWLEILESNDPEYIEKAKQQIIVLKQMLVKENI